VRTIRLLADTEFAPYAFQSAEGMAAGLAVDAGLAACAEIKLTCVVVPKATPDLAAALAAGEGDVIITGLKLDAAVLEKSRMTRPWFRSLGRFAVRTGSPLAGPDIRTLAGRRVGFVTGTSHAAFLATHYSRSALTGFATEAEMFEALRTGGLDAAFSDGLRVAFYINGLASRQCCEVLGGAFVDSESFTRPLSFLVRRDEDGLRAALDFALDRLQEKGVTSAIFARYLPDAIW
jgi:polar amino acid transport system substrate-binding protein